MALEAWLARHPRRVVAGLIGAALFVRLLLCLQIAAGPLPRIHALVPDSDNSFFHEWGRRVAAGDYLQRRPLQPMHSWMRLVAAEALRRSPSLPAALGLADGAHDPAPVEERLWNHWLRVPTFYQEPGYGYLVGATYAATGPDVWHVFAWQLVVGVIGVLLVRGIARRLFSETAGAVAGTIAVLAPIPLMYDVTLLRDGLVAFVTLALALLMHWAASGGRRRWLVLGLAFGAAAVLKQTFLAFPVLLAAWRLIAVRSPWRQRVLAGALVVGGMALAILPVVLRNLVVGVTPLAMNGSAATQLALFHTASAAVHDVVVSPEYVRVLVSSDGRLGPSLLGALQTHASGWHAAALELRRLLYTWHGYESPNNVDFYLFRQGAPVLGFLPFTFVVLLPLAVIGLASRRAADAWPILLAVAGSVPTLLLVAVLSRYRAPLTAALLPLAGAGAVRAASWVGARRWTHLGAAAVLTAAYAAWATTPAPTKAPDQRARYYLERGALMLQEEPSFAALHLQEAQRLAPDDRRVEGLLGQALLASGDAAAALPHAEAAARHSDSASTRDLLARTLASLGRFDEALLHARAAADAEPSLPGGRMLVEQLERDTARMRAARPAQAEAR